jgi:hypothetical protein
MTTKLSASTQQPSPKLSERIAASQNKCIQATRPPQGTDSFERIGKPGDAKAGAVGVTCAPTVTVGGIAAVVLAPVAGLVATVLAFIASPFVSTTGSSAT